MPSTEGVVVVRPSIVLLSLFAVSLAASVPGFSAPETVQNTDLASAVESAAEDCGPVTIEQLRQNEAFWNAYHALSEEAGFVDLYPFGGETPHLKAIFDLDARGGAPLPAAPAPVHGYPVEIRGERFQPLVADVSGLDASMLPLPQACYNRISPGVGIVIGNAGCSANFIFKDQLDRLYFGTAGHCGGMGARVSVSGMGQAGTIVYRINGGIGADFALVAIDADKYDRVNPAMCRWGGPETAQQGGPGLVYHYGNPIIWGQHHLTEARMGYSASGGGVNSFSFEGLVASGDSGSGAEMATGNALGIVTHVNLPVVFFAHSAPFAYGTTVGRGMALAEAATGLDLELVTAPLA